MKLGLLPGGGGTQRLPRLVGKGRALQLILTGGMITAQEAYRIGLVNEVVPAADLISRAEAILNEMAANAPIAIKYSLDAVNKGMETSQDEGLVLEASYSCCGRVHPDWSSRPPLGALLLIGRPTRFESRGFQKEGPHPYIRNAGRRGVRFLRCSKQTQVPESSFPMPTELSFTPPKGFKPMTSFNPVEPALKFDDLNQKTIPWAATKEDVAHWREHAIDDQNGSVGWDGLIIIVWIEPLGG